MRVLGIDLALADETTSIAVLTCAPEVMTVERTATGVTDDHLERLLADPTVDVVGINAPVTVSRSKSASPSSTTSAEHVEVESAGYLAEIVAVRLSTRYRVRATDRWRREHLRDLPTRTDRAAGQRAMAGLRSDRLFASYEPRQLDPTLTIRDVVEACPAVAMHQWGLPYAGYVAYEGRADIAEVRETIVAALASRIGIPAASVQARDGGQLNALMSALVAVAARLGLTERVPDEYQVHARAEGWACVPVTGSLDGLLRRLETAI